MTLNIRTNGTKPNRSIQNWLRKELRDVREGLQVHQADIALERIPDADPPYRVRLCLEVPNPQICVEEVDHTLRGAVGKAVRALAAKVSRRSLDWVSESEPIKRNHRSRVRT